ncbi:16736_t:CDS:2, partial [Entrophospora sp. SA101]
NARITIKIHEELQKEENITIAIDGWSDPNNRNLYNFVLMTSDRREYLWKIEDFSSFSITGDFLAAEIEK